MVCSCMLNFSLIDISVRQLPWTVSSPGQTLGIYNLSLDILKSLFLKASFVTLLLTFLVFLQIPKVTHVIVFMELTT